MKLTTQFDEERNKFVVGEEYWTFYMDTTNKGNALRNVVSVFKTKLVEKRPSQYETCGFYLCFELPSTLKLSNTMRHSLPIYMNGYGLAQCQYFTTEEEAIIAFDERIDFLAKYQTAADRDVMLTKKYHKSPSKISGIEKSALAWKNKLSEKEKTYLDWFIENY